jgi:hypothetical protein
LTGDIWYEVIGGTILPVDVARETPATLVLGDGSRVNKEKSGRTFVRSMADARREAIRNLEDDVAHCKRQIAYYREGFVKAVEALEILRHESSNDPED